MTVYRIKDMDKGTYWNGNSWAKITGKIYSTRKLAEKTLNDGKLGFYRKHHNINLKVIEATITDKE